MRNKEIFGMAARYVFGAKSAKKTNAQRSLRGAIIAVAISLVPLVIVQNVADAMIAGITSRIVELSSFHAQVLPYFAPDSLEDSIAGLKDVRWEIQKIDGVKKAFLEADGVALAAGKSARTGISLRAVESALFEDESFRSLLEVKSGVLGFPQDGSIVLGEKLAAEIGASCGDRIRIITIQGEGEEKKPKFSAFTVAGIVSCGYNELDALWGFVPFEKGAAIVSSSASPAFLTIKADDAFSRRFDETFFKVCAAAPGFRVFTWRDLHAAQYENLNSTRILLLLIMILIVAVASLNISSALVMLIRERQREIAILKSVGASPRDVRKIFSTAGVLTGLCGTAAGIPFGAVCAKNFHAFIAAMERAASLFSQGETKILNPDYYLQSFDVKISLSALALTAICTVALSFFASLVPARAASHQKPLEIFRKN